MAILGLNRVFRYGAETTNKEDSVCAELIVSIRLPVVQSLSVSGGTKYGPAMLSSPRYGVVKVTKCYPVSMLKEMFVRS